MDGGGVRRDSGELLSNFRDRLNPQGGPEMLIKFLVPDSGPELDPKLAYGLETCSTSYQIGILARDGKRYVYISWEHLVYTRNVLLNNNLGYILSVPNASIIYTTSWYTASLKHVVRRPTL